MPDPCADSDETRCLLDRAAAGDPDATGELLARHRPALVRFIDLHLDRAVRCRVDPSDVVQETQAAIARRLAEYLAGRPVPFHVWARRVAYDRVLNARRDQRAARRDVAREAADPDRSSVALAGALLDPGPTPSQAAADAELAARVAAAVDELAGADREVLVMRQVEGLSHEEIADLLGIDPAAARKRYGRALLRLERALAELGIGGEEP